MEGKERATYYLSKLFNEAEKKYTAMEKTYAGVVCVAQKLKHYFLAQEVQLIAKMDSIKVLAEKAYADGTLSQMAKLPKSV